MGQTTINPQRVALGSLLQKWRKLTPLSSAAVEAELRWYAGRCARVERGERVLHHAELIQLIRLYGIPPGEEERLFAIAEQARKREAPRRTADFAHTYLAYEREAAEFLYYADALVPALLQAPLYAAGVVSHAGAVPADIAARVDERMARQRILDRPDPPLLRVILGEAVTMQEVGGVDGLRSQLEHLLDVMEHRPNVQVRILPWTAGGHRALGSRFTLVKLTSPAPVSRVYIEGVTDATYIHDPTEVEEHERAFNTLWSTVALDAGESATILRRRIDTIGGSHGRDTLA